MFHFNYRLNLFTHINNFVYFINKNGITYIANHISINKKKLKNNVYKFSIETLKQHLFCNRNFIIKRRLI